MKMPKPEESEATIVQKEPPQPIDVGVEASLGKDKRKRSRKTISDDEFDLTPLDDEETKEIVKQMQENFRIAEAWAKENGLTEEDVFEIVERIRRKNYEASGGD